mmetsp:Transcript_4898/g.19607  ORF Transcript_4898/g.19607 Transcript_4898/m.19607 type:complete len:228 (-) Transcript_4898:1436-2119(-)
MRFQTWMRCGSECPSSTNIFFVYRIQIGYLWSPCGRRLGSAGVSALSACRTSSLDSGWHARSSATKTCRTIFSGAWYASRKWHTLTNANCFAPPSSDLRWFHPNLMSSLRWRTSASGTCRMSSVPMRRSCTRIASVCVSESSSSAVSSRSTTTDATASSVSTSRASSILIGSLAASASVASKTGITMSRNACVSSEGGALLFLNASRKCASTAWRSAGEKLRATVFL